MKKTITIALALIMLVFFAACGNNADTGDDSSAGTNTASELVTETVTGELITADIPEGWCLITSTDLNGAIGEDFIYHVANTDDIQIGDPYIQVKKGNGNLEEVKESLGDAFGTAVDPITTGDTTWYGRENGICAQMGDTIILALPYECDFSDTEVQAILGSIVLS